jgi:ABC-type cobalamin/Fe3+-siderophores transport system ATPase subunit
LAHLGSRASHEDRQSSSREDDAGQNNLAWMIRTEELSHHYGVKTALQGLNLRVEPGEVLGLLGPNGAGKSTTVKVLTGLIRPTSGRAWVAGFDVVREPLEAKRRLGYVPEQPALVRHADRDRVSRGHLCTASSRSGGRGLAPC